MTTRLPIRILALAAMAVAASAGAARGATRELKVTPEIERSVTRGLDYLARTQKPNGAWPGNYGNVSGVVGLAMMSFLAHGDVPDEGKYGHVIRRAVNYIVTHQESNGLLQGEGGSSPMYSHGFATMALGEVYGVMDDPRVGTALKKATGLIVKCQNSLGGWRYSVNSTDADTTVSGAQMMGLRAAANAGIEVPITAVQRGVAYYKSCFCPGGGFGYTGPSGPSPARSGIGLLILSLSGAYRSPEAKATAELLLHGGGSYGHGGYFYYMTYYCSQAMYQAGGKYWRYWNETMTPAIISMQAPDGSWPQQGTGGVVCNSAFALLSLEINYNLLPIYQR